MSYLVAGEPSEDGFPAGLAEAIARTPLHYYVLWSGEPFRGRAGSVAERAFRCIPEAGRAILLRELLLRAARLYDGVRLKPCAVREAVRAHQNAKPAVMLLLERQRGGDLAAAADVPYPAGFVGPIRRGQIIVPKASATSVPPADLMRPRPADTSRCRQVEGALHQPTSRRASGYTHTSDPQRLIRSQ